MNITIDLYEKDDYTEDGKLVETTHFDAQNESPQHLASETMRDQTVIIQRSQIIDEKIDHAENNKVLITGLDEESQEISFRALIMDEEKSVKNLQISNTKKSFLSGSFSE